MTKSITTQTLITQGIRFNTAVVSQPSACLFDPCNPHLSAQPVTQGGRNAAWFVLVEGTPAVLRHYKRGGLIAKIIRSSYFWLGTERTRSWAEYDVLLHLYNAGVAVPMPIAAQWKKHLGRYKAAILVARLPRALPIAHQLEKTAPKSVAFAVKQMHDAGVWHADLNVFNILNDDNDRIHLIDFDRARRLTVVDSKQRLNNLLRLRRSLIKVRGDTGLQWYEQFYQAYQQLSEA
ncbi:3-deoxy-D-manno-octulosonic acid kinase [Paenalcaligenes hominis]|uniref:3-deoxy-D-manno-octulosonic acid kinase n=1 Tax=Paenalcaligenes hominis TaxID=643674 RepID=UPI00352669C8